MGGKDTWVCKQEHAQMTFAALASILDLSDEPAAACNFSIPTTSCADQGKPTRMWLPLGKMQEHSVSTDN